MTQISDDNVSLEPPLQLPLPLPLAQSPKTSKDDLNFVFLGDEDQEEEEEDAYLKEYQYYHDEIDIDTKLLVDGFFRMIQNLRTECECDGHYNIRQSSFKVVLFVLQIVMFLCSIF